jgi:hypothetical protein
MCALITASVLVTIRENYNGAFRIPVMARELETDSNGIDEIVGYQPGGDCEGKLHS